MAKKQKKKSSKRKPTTKKKKVVRCVILSLLLAIIAFALVWIGIVVARMYFINTQVLISTPVFGEVLLYEN